MFIFIAHFMTVLLYMCIHYMAKSLSTYFYVLLFWGCFSWSGLLGSNEGKLYFRQKCASNFVTFPDPTCAQSQFGVEELYLPSSLKKNKQHKYDLNPVVFTFDMTIPHFSNLNKVMILTLTEPTWLVYSVWFHIIFWLAGL